MILRNLSHVRSLSSKRWILCIAPRFLHNISLCTRRSGSCCTSNRTEKEMLNYECQLKVRAAKQRSTERREGNFPVDEQSAFQASSYNLIVSLITRAPRLVELPFHFSLFSRLCLLARPLCRQTSNALGQHKSNYRLQRAIDTTETLSAVRWVGCIHQVSWVSSRSFDYKDGVRMVLKNIINFFIIYHVHFNYRILI